MDINDYDFHDTVILKVTEEIGNQYFCIDVDFPIDWENNIFQHKKMVFNNVTKYLVEEIPFFGNPTILEINNLRKVNTSSNILPLHNHIKIVTNAGTREIIYDFFELI